MDIFDIETCPLSRAELSSIEPKFEAPKNYTDPEKIKIAVEKKRADWYSKAALNPTTGQVGAIGIFDSINDTTILLQGEEKDILTEFWNRVSSGPILTRELVGWNSNSFDIPFLLKRAWKYNIHTPRMLTNSKWLPKQCIDLLEIWTINGGDRISLDNVCKFLGIKGKNGDGANFHVMLDEDPDMAMKYLENDVRITTEVATRFGIL